jgi:hypothetical protein
LSFCARAERRIGRLSIARRVRRVWVRRCMDVTAPRPDRRTLFERRISGLGCSAQWPFVAMAWLAATGCVDCAAHSNRCSATVRRDCARIGIS